MEFYVNRATRVTGHSSNTRYHDICLKLINSAVLHYYLALFLYTDLCIDRF